MLFNGPDNPKSCRFPLGIWTPNSISNKRFLVPLENGVVWGIYGSLKVTESSENSHLEIDVVWGSYASRVQFPAGPLSRNIGQLSRTSLGVVKSSTCFG